MYKLITGKGILEPYQYASEREFEREIIKNKEAVFGRNAVYFDVKKKVGNTVPDGYCIDLTFHTEPKLYFVEIEMTSHDVYGHIAEQLLKFSTAFDDSKRRLNSILKEEIEADGEKQGMLTEYIAHSGFRDITALLYHLVYELPISIMVIIDEYAQQLERVQSKLTDEITVLVFESYRLENEVVHRFTPFHDDEMCDENGAVEDADDLDTIIVPANEAGFVETFLGEDCWYEIRISASMIKRIRYIAGYQTAPISAVTHYAAVDRIERYEDTEKYIVYFKGKAKKIEAIPLGDNKMAVRSCRYTNLQRMLNAASVTELFENG